MLKKLAAVAFAVILSGCQKYTLVVHQNGTDLKFEHLSWHQFQIQHYSDYDSQEPIYVWLPGPNNTMQQTLMGYNTVHHHTDPGIWVKGLYFNHDNCDLYKESE